MEKRQNLRYKITLYFPKTGNVFESYVAKTRKEAEKIIRERKKEMQNWHEDEKRPSGVSKAWVLV